MKPDDMKLNLCLAFVSSISFVLPNDALADESHRVNIRPVSLQIVSANFEANKPAPWNLENSFTLGLLVESEVTPIVAINDWDH